MLIGGLVLVGWILDLPLLKSMLPGLVAMKANTAVAFLLAGMSLRLLQRERTRPAANLVAQICAAIVALIGLLTIGQYLFGWNLGIDELLFRESSGAVGTLSPGRMGLASALNFSLVGAALLLLSAERAYGYSQLLVLVVAIVSWFLLAGYVYGVDTRFGVAFSMQAALPGVIAFILLCHGVLAARPDKALMSMVTANTPGGIIIRRLAPPAAFLPLVFGWVALTGHRSGIFSEEFAVSLDTVATTVIATGLILWVATVLDRAHIERVQVEDALRDSEERLRTTFEQAAVGIAHNAIDGRWLRMNERLCEIVGYTREELLGLTFQEITHPEDLSTDLEYVRQILAGETKNYAKEKRYVRKDGSYVWVNVTVSLVRDDSGSPKYLISVVEDIASRKKAEERLGLLATGVEQAAESIVITDVDGAIQYVNPAFESTTGYELQEVISQNPRLLQSGKQDDSFYSEMWNTILRGEVWTGRFINKRKDGTLFEEEATISPVRDGSGRIVNFVAVKRDVTKEVELERQLLHSQKMEAVGRLAGGIAHDFNNLLTAIIGYGQLVEARLGHDHALRPDVEQILEAGQRAAALTGQLLAFSRRQTLIRRNINLNDTIANLMRMLRRIIGEDIELNFRADSDLQHVFADAGQIDQVMMNLAVNARDAMPGGGKLSIETQNVTLDEAYCREHLWARPGNYVRISVSDSGVGMDAETQRRIFEPFFTTKEIGKGTGLGLSVVYGIVQQHGGLVHLYSEPGHGTTFKIYLKAESPPGIENAPESQSALRGGSETILLAEDEETLRELASTILRSLGYQVLLVNNGEEAVLTYEAVEGKIDLVILDLIMPRMSGREAYERIRVLRGGECPVIFMTGYAPEIRKNELAGADSAALVQKPYELDELGRKVRDVLDAHAGRTHK